MKTGLVLEGGAMRGMFTAGVLDVLMEKDVKIDGIVGVSAGALFGVNYASGQIGRAIRYNKKYNGDRHYMGVLPLLREGNIVSTEFAYRKVPRELDPFDDDAFRKRAMPFYAVVTRVEDGQPEYHEIHSVFEQMETLRASGSMPFVSKPVILDGGISDSIPFRWMQAQGVEKIVVVLTQAASYRKKAEASALIRLYGRKFPAIAEALKTRPDRYNGTVRELCEEEAAGNLFVIRPPKPLDVKKIEKDPKKLQRAYDVGRAEAEAVLPSLRAFLESY